jgi:hypothetical protein
METIEFTAASVAFDVNNVGAQKPISAATQSALLRAALKKTEEQRHAVGLSVGGV